MQRRKSGILLHLTSLPGNQGIGTMGSQAHTLLEILHDFDQHLWQFLPLHPTNSLGSPFQGPSIFAGNPFLIDLEMLLNVNDLTEEEYQSYLHAWNTFDVDKNRSNLKIDFEYLRKEKLNRTLVDAFWGFTKRATSKRKQIFQEFCSANQDWLETYANFMALKDWYGQQVPWNEWDEADKFMTPKMSKHLNPDVIAMMKYVQFVFDEQMKSLRQKAKDLNIELIGDLPFYPDFDSADVWANQYLFMLNQKTGKMKAVAAVPPDYFSASGQLWGSPLYNWGKKSTNLEVEIFTWWQKRLKRELEYIDTIKLDHFRGFVAFGQVSFKSKTAKSARWIPGPGQKFFDFLKKSMPKLPVICEDLGIVTMDVRKLQQKIGPRMRVFVFINPEKNMATNTKDPNLPHNLKGDGNCVYYTGTHDNETLAQWLEKLSSDQKQILNLYLGSNEPDLRWKIIDRISSSEAERVIFPIQDILGLEKEARLNRPGVAHNQWAWRLSEPEFHSFLSDTCKKLQQITIRNHRS